MWQLNLPAYKFNIKRSGNKYLIFDNQRRKFVALTPEEWVRQNFIQYLIQEKKYPAAWIAVEKQLVVNGMKKRCDAIFYSGNATPLLILEFKSPDVSISQKTFDQAAVYNTRLQVDHFILSNGFEHYFCRINTLRTGYEISQDIPDFSFFQG